MKNKLKLSMTLTLFVMFIMNNNVLGQAFPASITVDYDISQCENTHVDLIVSPDNEALYTYTWTCPGGPCPSGWDGPFQGAFFPTTGQITNANYSVLITEIATN